MKKNAKDRTLAEELNAQRRQCVVRKRVTNIFGWAAVVLAVSCMIGLIVCIVMLGVGESEPERDTKLAFCCLGTLIGMAVFWGSALALFGAGVRAAQAERDLVERLNGEDCFFVGEGTIATFSEKGILLHGESGKRRVEIPIPYAEMRFFTVCTRHEPKEKGEWSVVMEIPAHYLIKKGKTKPGDPPALVQTDGKERLYACLEKYGIACLGERPPRGKEGKDKKVSRYSAIGRFVLPDGGKRKKMLIFVVIGFLISAGGLAAGFLWNAAAGSVVCLVGAYIALRAAAAFRKAATRIVLYRQGIFWADRTKADSRFLKWEEVESVSHAEEGETPRLRVKCLYGAYEFPAPRGAYVKIAECFPEKCTQG